MSKFLLNLLVQISKALVYLKIQFLFEKEFSSDFGPFGPAPPALAHFAPQATGSLLSSFGPSSFGVFVERRISFDFVHSGRDAFSLSPSPRRPTVAASPHHLWPPCATWPPTSRCQVRSSLPALISPFNSPLNPSSSRPAINGVKAITIGCFPLPLPGHYKRVRSTPGHHHSHPAFLCSLPSSQLPPHPAPTAATRAPVRPEPSSPCSPLSVVPPSMSFHAPEWPEAMLR
jgi:hypothetical protein